MNGSRDETLAFLKIAAGDRIASPWLGAVDRLGILGQDARGAVPDLDEKKKKKKKKNKGAMRGIHRGGVSFGSACSDASKNYF
jgi:hypothetical protein